MASPLPPAETYGAVPSAQDLAAMGMTSEQFADLQKSIASIDLSKLAVNPFGTIDLIGGRSPYGVDESKYMVKAPLSNKGNPTSTYSKSSNDFFVYDNQPVRLVDKATNQIVFEGSGPEDARKASELAAQLTAQGGRKASWDIQTGPGIDLSGYGAGQSEGWKTVANEKRNKSTLGKIGSIAGTVLPLAMIPLTMGASAPLAGLGAAGNVALGAGVGAASAGLKGQNILKGGLMGGLTSAGGQFLSGPLKGVGLGADAARAVGTGIGATAGGLATGQSLENSLLGGVAAGGTTYLGGKLFGPSQQEIEFQRGLNKLNADLMGDIDAFNIDAGDAFMKAYSPQGGGLASSGANGVSFGQAPSAVVPATDLTVTGTRIGATPSSAGAAPSFAVNVPTGGTPETIVTAQRQTPVAEQPSFAVNVPTQTPAVGGPDLEETIVTAQDEGLTQAEGEGGVISDFGVLSPEIIATARREAGLQDKDNGVAVNVPTGTPETVVTAPKDQAAVKDEGAVGGTYIPPKSDIVVTGDKGTPKFDDKGEYTGPLVNIPSLVDDAVQEELAGKKTEPKKKMDLDKITDYMELAGLVLPLLGGGGGGKGSAGKYSSTGRLNPAFSAKLPTPGQGGSFTVGGLGGTAADRTLAARPVTDWYRYGMGPAMDIPAGADLSRATSPYAGYGPGTLGEETFKAVSGIPEQPVGMAHGGDMGYSRGSSRESFAVNGPGTGRSDDIPAVLSDGEYVIDAETVALLGDGSSKAGAKKLDEMRVKIRKAKGKNLAKGKFSVNAKRPEAYMSGGRI